LEDIPALLPRRRQQRADHGKIHRTLHGAEAAGDLLAQFHHSPVPFRQVVAERHKRVCEKAQHVGFSAAEPQEQIVANPAWRPTATFAFADSADQCRLRVMECQAVHQDGVITSLEQSDQARLQRHAALTRQVAGVAGAAQQALHPARPVLFFDLDQRLQFAQMMRVAQRM